MERVSFHGVRLDFRVERERLRTTKEIESDPFRDPFRGNPERPRTLCVRHGIASSRCFSQ
jgi:hypothetical protein